MGRTIRQYNRVMMKVLINRNVSQPIVKRSGLNCV